MTVQKYAILLIPPKFWDILHTFVISGKSTIHHNNLQNIPNIWQVL